MSKRWFILAFSIIFFVAFRLWLNDLTLSDTFRPSAYPVVDLITDEDNQLLIFPASGQTDLYRPKMAYVNPVDRNRGQQLESLYTGYKSLYIFPAWPDTLAISFREVVVDNHGLFNPYIKSDLDFRDN